jgi:hypothetical protein
MPAFGSRRNLKSTLSVRASIPMIAIQALDGNAHHRLPTRSLVESLALGGLAICARLVNLVAA